MVTGAGVPRVGHRPVRRRDVGHERPTRHVGQLCDLPAGQVHAVDVEDAGAVRRKHEAVAVRRPARVALVVGGAQFVAEIAAVGRDRRDVARSLGEYPEQDARTVRRVLRRIQLKPALAAVDDTHAGTVGVHNGHAVASVGVQYAHELPAVGRPLRLGGARLAGDARLLLRGQVIHEQVTQARPVRVRAFVLGVRQPAAVGREHRPRRDPALDAVEFLAVAPGDVQAGRGVVAALVAEKCNARAVRAERRRDGHEAVVAHHVTRAQVGLHRRELPVVAGTQRRHPVPVDVPAALAGDVLHGAVHGEPVELPQALVDPVDRLGAVGGGDVAHQAVAVVVDLLVAEPAMPQKPHVVVGQHAVLGDRHAQDHVAVRVPAVIALAGRLVLRHSLGPPRRYHGARDGIRDDQVGIAGDHVGALLGLEADGLEVQRGNAQRHLHGCLDGDDVGELVGDDVLDPVGRSPQAELQVGGPDLDLVVVVVGCAVGVVLGVEDHEVTALGLVLVHPGDEGVDLLGNPRHFLRGPLRACMVVDVEVFGGKCAPVEAGVGHRPRRVHGKGHRRERSKEDHAADEESSCAHLVPLVTTGGSDDQRNDLFLNNLA